MALLPPPELSCHFCLEILFSSFKKSYFFLSGPAFTVPPPLLSGRATKKITFLQLPLGSHPQANVYKYMTRRVLGIYLPGGYEKLIYEPNCPSLTLSQV